MARNRPPDTEVDQEILSQDYQIEISHFITGEHDTRRGGTRSHPMGRAPDTDVLRVILQEIYLVNVKEYLAHISFSVSGEHNTRGRGKKSPSNGSCS